MHPSSMESCQRFIAQYLLPRKDDHLRIVDVGSLDVNGCYRELFSAPNWEYVGIDVTPGPNVDVVVPEEGSWMFNSEGMPMSYNPRRRQYTVPSEEHNSFCSSPQYDKEKLKLLSMPFDVIISGQCLEHVRKPWLWIKQISQLAKFNGLIWITAPNTWCFHEYPIDCWRVWPDGLRALFDEAGFETLEAYTTGPEGYDTVGIAKANGKGTPYRS